MVLILQLSQWCTVQYTSNSTVSFDSLFIFPAYIILCPLFIILWPLSSSIVSWIFLAGHNLKMFSGQDFDSLSGTDNNRWATCPPDTITVIVGSLTLGLRSNETSNFYWTAYIVRQILKFFFLFFVSKFCCLDSQIKKNLSYSDFLISHSTARSKMPKMPKMPKIFLRTGIVWKINVNGNCLYCCMSFEFSF